MERHLVIGALGCIGAWAVRRLLADGVEVVLADAGSDRSRLRLVLGAATAESLDIEHCDVADEASVAGLFERVRPTHVIHLAGLQLPACRANPVLGARVNVGGTANVFEACRRTDSVTAPLVYASSVAVFGPADQSPALNPTGNAQTHYGVYKGAGEDLARVYAAEHGLSSYGVRPYVVYGPGRDQGLTSAPTLAMKAAMDGRSFEIGYGGLTQMQFAPDAADIFVDLSRASAVGASVVNADGPVVRMSEVVAAIEEVRPAARGLLSYLDLQLPFPGELDPVGLVHALPGRGQPRPLVDGVRETIEWFQRHPA